MAEAMQNAFAEEWRLRMGRDLPDNGRGMLEMVFVAIAQGVVRHLVDNKDAFVVAITTTQVDRGGNPILSQNDGDIEVVRTFTNSMIDRWLIQANALQVSQISDALESHGDQGNVSEIKVRGTLYGSGP